MGYWDTTADRTQGTYTPDQFEAAAYRLVAEQVLYAADLKSRVHYALVEQFERDFKQALSAMGIGLHVNRQLRYACALAQHMKAAPATTEQTLFALVLRKIYDESARVGQLSDEGEVTCDLVELDEKYKLATRREMPVGGRLDDLLRTMKRWGIARASREDSLGQPDVGDQPYLVMIRPAIADILGEGALLRLALFSESGGKPDLLDEDGRNDADDIDNAVEGEPL